MRTQHKTLLIQAASPSSTTSKTIRPMMSDLRSISITSSPKRIRNSLWKTSYSTTKQTRLWPSRTIPQPCHQQGRKQPPPWAILTLQHTIITITALSSISHPLFRHHSKMRPQHPLHNSTSSLRTPGISTLHSSTLITSKLCQPWCIQVLLPTKEPNKRYPLVLVLISWIFMKARAIACKCWSTSFIKRRNSWPILRTPSNSWSARSSGLSTRRIS